MTDPCTTMRGMVTRNLEEIRESLSGAQAELLRLPVDIDSIDDLDILASLVEGTASLAKSQWPSNVQLVVILISSLAKKGEEAS